MDKVYIIKRGSQTVGAVVDDAPRARFTLDEQRLADFQRYRQAYRDFVHYLDTHHWWIEEVQVL